jgi:hypothetical protein
MRRRTAAATAAAALALALAACGGPFTTAGAGPERAAAQGTTVCAFSTPGVAVNALAPALSFPTASGSVQLFRWASNDTAMVTVASGAPFALTPGQVLVRFGTQTAWDKELVAREFCGLGDIGRLFAPGGRTNPGSLLINRSFPGSPGADTLVFRKPGFLGWWIDSASFTVSSFWSAFGGRAITITWLSD